MKEEECIVCGHKLCDHIDEGNGWRCHSLGVDTRQCECFLRKHRDLFGEVSLDYYSVQRRVEEAEKEIERLEKMLEKEMKERWQQIIEMLFGKIKKEVKNEKEADCEDSMV